MVLENLTLKNARSTFLTNIERITQPVTDFIRGNPIVSTAAIGAGTTGLIAAVAVVRRRKAKKRVAKRKKRRVAKRKKPTRKKKKRVTHRSPRHKGHKVVKFKTKDGKIVRFKVKKKNHTHKRRRRRKK